MERHDGERTVEPLDVRGHPLLPDESIRLVQTAGGGKNLFPFPSQLHLLLFIMLLGFYILMRAFNASPLVSALGALLGLLILLLYHHLGGAHLEIHHPRLHSPTIAGMVYTYRKKYLPGGLLLMVFVAFQLSSNHFQMTYYFPLRDAFPLDRLPGGAIRKRMADFWKSTRSGHCRFHRVAANTSNLYHTYEYSQETMRGKSELTHHGDANRTGDGLERDYITAWSYGIGETWTLLVPNTKGGASVPLSLNEKAMSKAKPEYAPLFQQIGQYWGEQPGTSGPVYVGAFVLTLFVLGLFIVKGPIKWALLVGTLFSITLSWGKNFMGLTDFFIDHVPLYNKFRAVSSILVVAEFCIPLLAALAVKELIQKPETLKKDPRPLYISLGVTGGIALIFASAPKLFFSSYISSTEMMAFQQLPPEHIQPFIANLTDARISIFTADAWRSFFIVAIGAVIVWLFIRKKIKPEWMVAGILLLCLVDMWGEQAIPKRR